MLSMLTEEERDQLRELYHQLDSKFDEIVSFLKRTLGCSEADAYEEAEQAIDRWNEDVETFGPGWSSFSLIQFRFYCAITILSARLS